jgi:flagellar hook assembly protein FlgD
MWDGKDGDGRALPSGLYTVLVNSGGTKKLKTVAISNK